MIDRRRFLEALGAALAFGGAREARAGEQPTPGSDPLIVRVAAPQDLETPLSYFDQLITPTPSFFVRSHFGPPALDRDRKLAIAGLVRGPLVLTADQLKSGFKEATVTAVLQCAGNARSLHSPRVPGVQWGHGAMGQATFTGVRLKDVLEKAGVDKEAKHVKLAGADVAPKPTVPAFVRSIPIERAMDPSTIIAWAMNGEPLTHAHGAPLRLVVPGWAGDHWMKWLARIEPQKDEMDGFYMQTAYKMPITPVTPGATPKPEEMRSLTTFPVKSVIARPREGDSRNAGPQEVTGCAFSGDAAIKKVEVSIDGGATWKAATLEGDAGAGRWQVWKLAFEAKTKGKLTAIVRATDAKGNVQPKSAVWNPSGYFWNGWHAVTWVIA